MSQAKEKIMEVLEGLPEDASFEEILRELAFVRMVERGLADSDAGRSWASATTNVRRGATRRTTSSAGRSLAISCRRE